ncbi:MULTISPECIES: SUKH-4 family immunity protein [Streptomyces]|uniref:SUKH-4 family immunity protein n=1 Tax=Streptomyces TaxID=1883 RepID=UPI000A5F644E|nr:MULTISPECIES: SUKH-4 family immunity protein [Streptomyces]
MTTVDRAMLENQFSAGEVVTLAEEELGGIGHEPSRRFLREVGLPVRANPWFDLIDRCDPKLKKAGACYEDLRARWVNLPGNAADWVLIGMIPYDDIALDVATGAVLCLPQDEDEVYPLNKDLCSFAHFLCLLEAERPNYDEEMNEDLDYEKAEQAGQRLGEQMRAIDPAALDVPHSRWHDILAWISDPDAR